MNWIEVGWSGLGLVFENLPTKSTGPYYTKLGQTNGCWRFIILDYIGEEFCGWVCLDQ